MRIINESFLFKTTIDGTCLILGSSLVHSDKQSRSKNLTHSPKVPFNLLLFPYQTGKFTKKLQIFYYLLLFVTLRSWPTLGTRLKLALMVSSFRNPSLGQLVTNMHRKIQQIYDITLDIRLFVTVFSFNF